MEKIYNVTSGFEYNQINKAMSGAELINYAKKLTKKQNDFIRQQNKQYGYNYNIIYKVSDVNNIETAKKIVSLYGGHKINDKNYG